MKYIVALILAFATFTASAEKVKQFDLNKPMQERVFLCLVYEEEEVMLGEAIKGDTETLKMLSMDAQLGGRCGAFVVEITYVKLRKEGKDAQGNLYTIYEAKVGEHTVFVPLKNYRHKGDI